METIRVVEWPPDVENGADINGRLVEDPDGFKRWAAQMIAAARPLEKQPQATSKRRAGEPDRYSLEGSSRNGKAPAKLPVGLLLSEVVPERVDWLWRGRIPKGKLTLMDGDPGEGKSALSGDLAARKSAGRAWQKRLAPSRRSGGGSGSLDAGRWLSCGVSGQARRGLSHGR